VAGPAGEQLAPVSAGDRPQLRVVREPRPRTWDARKVARTDLLLLAVPAGFLTATGLVMVLSAGSVSAAQGYDNNPFWYFQRQSIYAAVGLAAGLAVALLPTRPWRRAALPLLVIACVLMFIAAHPGSGTSFYGASRWIDLGPMTLQPSEVAKLGLVSFAAVVLTNKWGRLDRPAHLMVPLAPAVAIVAGLGILQSDLGTTLILVGTVFLMVFAAGVRMRYMLVSGFFGLLAVAYLIVGTGYRRVRLFESWMDPWSDPRGDGYQLIQSLIAIGSGGWTGSGLGTSRAKWDFLPNAHSDFIYAVIGEELGILGALVVLAAFALLVVAGIRIAIHAAITFDRLLATGVISWLGLQAIINMGGVTGLLPITGVPLPLVSFGGTALVVSLAGVGVLASIARRPLRKDISKRQEDLR
jgi:cell division protein FtsW